MLGAQGKLFEPYFSYGEDNFPLGIQRFSQGKKKSGKKFRIIATLISSFHNADAVK